MSRFLLRFSGLLLFFFLLLNTKREKRNTTGSPLNSKTSDKIPLAPRKSVTIFVAQ